MKKLIKINIGTNYLKDKKMKKKILMVFSLTSFASSLMAQSAFEGFYGQVGLGYESNSASEAGSTYVSSGSTTRNSLNRIFSNSNGLSSAVGIGYTRAITPKLTLGIGAEYYPFASSSTGYTSSIAGVSSGTGSWNKENSYNIFLSPGVVVSKDGLAYAKVGYSRMQAKSGSTGAASDTSNHKGYSLGLGFKQIIQGGIYGFVEGNYFKYNDLFATSVNSSGTAYLNSGTSSYNLLIGVGYKF